MDSYDAAGDVVKTETTTFGYDETGIRRTSTHKIEEDTDGNNQKFIDPERLRAIRAELKTTIEEFEQHGHEKFL